MDQPTLHKFFKTHDYLQVRVPQDRSPADTANYWAGMGWRVVSVYTTTATNQVLMLLERPVGIHHPADESHRY